jgi:hypothetical protein
MKSSLIAILIKALFGKKIAKQEGIHEKYWGKTITDVYPCSYNCGEDIGYNIQVDGVGGFDVFIINIDFELEVE